MSTRSRSSLSALRRIALTAAAPLLAAACSSSGSGATTGGLCVPLQVSDCTGPASCAGHWTCDSKGTSYGPCNCISPTTGGKGSGTTGGVPGTTGTTGGATTGGKVTTGTGSTTGPSTTLAVGTTIIPGGPSTGLMTITIDAINLDTTPQPGGNVNASGHWNSSASSFTGNYDTAARVLSLSSTAYGASFSGMLANGVISGDWTGPSHTSPWPFSLVLVPQGGKGYAFCGENNAETESLGVAFASDGTLGAVDGPAPSAPTGASGVLGGSYSNNLASVNSIGNFILSNDTDGGLSFKFSGTGWSMDICQ